ncbi:hypothetical protein LTR99_005743 [Exophiala xenobiotica]|uniref:Uncharacterized protein n=1 Tax=Vermiconidia calcicola TaxID=1690605 RepID=A0AAV9QGF6_9PEZI|nr:hypothetical protein H2202_000382 [Exophiala xenobiotica]KAK5541183.1 hypothetical protein LTR25_002960 [Vermiconidia calcicola]KAK5549324.1 hypothetical protein LTR23_000432 [Chaetothyriales sp. CCFEE 6169]KAK5194027.1 hypothetical protein LTR92_006367 [Exophiala xenobiotica]KAK5211659.1 hypothetical protein LTR41_003120 [Exophiala xenobiotica]
MAPSSDTTDAKNAVKDAMYLFDLFRESPQPVLINIGPYAAKTGAKPNTIVKRLGEIKKRNHLNIITTTQGPSDAAGVTAIKARKPRAPTAKPVKAEAEDAGAPTGLPSPAESAAGMPAYMTQKKKKRSAGECIDVKEEDLEMLAPSKKMKTEEA